MSRPQNTQRSRSHARRCALEALESRVLLSNTQFIATAMQASLNGSTSLTTNYGDPVTLNVTLDAGSYPLAGTLTVRDYSVGPYGVQVGVYPASNNLNTVTLPVFTVGPHNLEVVYSGWVYATAASANLSLTVTPDTPTLVLHPLAAGTYLLDAELTTASGLHPTGTVSLQVDQTPLAAVTLSNGHAQFDLSTVSPGPHTLTATYGGDSNFAGTTRTLDQLVPLYTTTQLTCSRDIATVGQPLVWTATVTPAEPGVVTFFDNGVSVGTASLNQGVAALSAPLAAAGDHALTATFSPQGNYLASTSSPVHVTAFNTTVLDLLALYTNQELQAAGSVSAIMAGIQRFIDDTNTVMTNSLDPISVRLVGLVPANYNESGSLAKDWNRLQNTSDGAMDNVASLRNRFGADLVVLLDSQSSPVGGNSLDVVQGEGSLLTVPIWQTSFQDRAAYIVISMDAPENSYVLAHEIGHTLGASHAVGDPGDLGVSRQGHGYRFVGNDGQTYHDVMAYDPGITIPYYSNQGITYQGVLIGTLATSDAADLFRITGPSVAAYRTAQPFGSLTLATATTLSGWVVDPQALAVPSMIRIDIDGTTVTSFRAAEQRADLLTIDGVTDHGFTFAMPHLAAGNHAVKVYALDAATGAAVLVATRTLAADHLVFTQQPTTIVAGQSITPALVVSVKDSANHVDTAYNGTLTLALATFPTGATASGTLTATLVNGTASFDSVLLTKAGAYTFAVTDGTLAARSNRLTVSPDTASSHLVLVSASASSAIVGRPLASVVVQDVDQFANPVTTDHSAILLSSDSGTFTGPHSAALRNATATFSNLIFNTVGTYTLTAAPATNSTLASATPVSLSQTIIPATTNPIHAPSLKTTGYAFGTTLTLSSTLTSNAPKNIPFTGTVTLSCSLNGTASSFTGSLTSTGAIRFASNALTPGSYTSQIDYAGDLNHLPASSTPFTLLITPATTKTALLASTTSLVFGQPLTLTATVTSSTAPATARTGSINFFDGTTLLQNVTLASSAAAFTFTPSSVGKHNFQAVYLNDANFLASTSALLTRTVNKDNISLQLAATASALAVNQIIDLNVQATVLPPGLATLTGNLVTIKDNGKPIGTLTLTSTGAATLASLNYTAPGTHTLTALYPGDAATLPATSSVLKLTVS